MNPGDSQITLVEGHFAEYQIRHELWPYSRYSNSDVFGKGVTNRANKIVGTNKSIDARRNEKVRTITSSRPHPLRTRGQIGFARQYSKIAA